MRRIVSCALLAFFIVMSIDVMGQSYQDLWKKVDEAALKDLPQTQRTALRQIIAKAEKEQAYGQLLKAELMDARVATMVSPDSLPVAVERLKKREETAPTGVLRAVYQTVIGRVYSDNPQLDENAAQLSADYFQKAMQHPAELAAVKATDYKPFVTDGEDSRIYGDDLLSVIGYETKLFAPLHQYYLTTSNRRAQLFSALELLRANSRQDDAETMVERLDSLINVYGDLQECGEAAIQCYECMLNRRQETAPEQLVAFIDNALQKWGAWKRMNVLRNYRHDLTRLMYTAMLDEQLTIPQREQRVHLRNLRGISSITMNVYRVKADGNIRLNPIDAKDFRKLQPLLTQLPLTQTLTFTGKREYDIFEDSLTLQGLPVGVYLLEFKSQPSTQVSRSFCFVSDLRVMVESLPKEQRRYVVVNATTGQPVAGATLQLSHRVNNTPSVTLTTDKNGECLYDMGNKRLSRIYVSTSNDQACPPIEVYGNFSYYANDRELQQVAVYTDRALYRPGQKVQAAAILYKVKHGHEHEVVAGKTLTARLFDANYQLVEEKTVTSDDFGTVSTEFQLPSKGLTGRFTVDFDGHSQSIRVEEYKRPTFQVEFEKVTQDYKNGDTLALRASAKSYAGVPVTGARVSYTVERRLAWWWVTYYPYWQGGTIGRSSNSEVVFKGEALTEADGTFQVSMPMVLPKSSSPLFYNFVVTADVTDVAGETHQGQLSLPLGNRPTAFTADLDEKMRSDRMGRLKLHLLNAAGNDVESTARYRIDEGKWVETPTNVAIDLPKLKSGEHRMQAVCGSDTLERKFVVFSLDDKRPALETDDWFYVSDPQFPNDGTPVTVQVGSSAKNVHIVYTIVAGDKVIENGRLDRSNELYNRKFTYQEDYGNGLTLNFAWVREGKTYTHETTIRRPLPDKQLRLRWETFRDRLVPGQQEEWTLTMDDADGKAVAAQLMATLYDKSLDQLLQHQWTLQPYVYLPLASLQWSSGYRSGIYCSGTVYGKGFAALPLTFRSFDEDCFPTYWLGYGNHRLYSMGGHARRNQLMMAKSTMYEAAVEETEGAMLKASEVMADANSATPAAVGSFDAKLTADEADNGQTMPEVQVRENLQETAFFFPRLQADSTGHVSLKFTLPESLTTWRFMGIAHTQDMMCGMLEGETVAQKDVMIQPNVPRFIRVGDRATISARVVNTTDHAVSGTALMELSDPESGNVILSERLTLTLSANDANAVTFQVDGSQLSQYSLLVCKMVACGDTFSDGEQHYLPVLPNRERVTVTVPFTQTEPGTKTIDLTQLLPQNIQNNQNTLSTPNILITPTSPQLTIEYTNNPAWLMIQALPTVANPCDQSAISQAAAFYANSLGSHLLKQNPNAKHVFEMWKRDDSSLHSSLQKNEELKDLVLSETPWVMDAVREEDQKQRLGEFFDESLLQSRLSAAADRLQQLQNSNGSWSWWEGMQGSFYMTVEISEMLARLNQMTGAQQTTTPLLDKAFTFMDKEIVELVKEMKKEEKKGIKQTFPSHKALQYLYIYSIDGRKPTAQVASAQTYLKNLLKKESRRLTIYDKAMASIVLNSGEFLKSLHEWSTYKEGVGRYYDTPRAAYSWRNYRIPTQVAVIEAFKRLTPSDEKTVREMQQWLLHEKRAQAWDTPINSVDAVYAFLNGRQDVLAAQPKTVLKIDGALLPTSEATAGIGYVKTAVPLTAEPPKTFSAEKTSTGTSWGAVYAQFMQDTKDISDQSSELSVKREILSQKTQSTQNNQSIQNNQSSFRVGQRIRVRLTIEAERDLDFVEVIDRRAACMEPIGQLSGYRNGAYCTPRDNATHYYFDLLPKGRHVIETEYYLDRAGHYETGTCIVQCAYAPEYRGTTHSQTIIVEE